MKRKRVVLTVAGSDGDGPQTKDGLNFMITARDNQDIEPFRDVAHAEPMWIDGLGKLDEATGHYTVSSHRNNMTLVDFCDLVARIAKKHPDTDYMLVMGAGWAAVLPGLAAAILYHQQHGVTNVFVVAVAFESFPSEDFSFEEFTVHESTSALHIHSKLSPKQRRDLAALLSISEVPDNLMITGDGTTPFFGSMGWKSACKSAVNDEIPEHIRQGVANIKKKKKKDPKFRVWKEAVEVFTTKAEAK